jgi:hypothetical protein
VPKLSSASAIRGGGHEQSGQRQIEPLAQIGDTLTPHLERVLLVDVGTLGDVPRLGPRRYFSKPAVCGSAYRLSCN